MSDAINMKDILQILLFLLVNYDNAQAYIQTHILSKLILLAVTLILFYQAFKSTETFKYLRIAPIA